MGRWKALGGPQRRLVGCLADLANTANTRPMGKEPRIRECDEKNSTHQICGFSSKKLTEYKLIATNSSDRLRHVPNYFSIFFNKSACCLQKKKKKFSGAQSAGGPICRGPICRGPICRGPICRGPICHKKSLGAQFAGAQFA